MSLYVLDTSSLIHAWVRAYPPRHFRSIWNHIEDLIENNRAMSSIEVLRELTKRDDDLYAWAKDYDMFLEIDDSIQVHVATLLGKYPRLVDTKKNRSGADPFVIAVAAAQKKEAIVVSEENPTMNMQKPRIPDVCRAEGIECIRFLELIQREDWRL